MFERLGSWTYRFRFLIVLAWIVGAVLCARFAPSLAGSGSTDQASFLPPGSPSVLARDALERAFPGSSANSSASITFDRATGLTDADRAYMAEFAAWTTSTDAPPELQDAVTSTESAETRPELEAMLRSEDGQFDLLIVNLDVANAGDEAALVVDQLRTHLAETAQSGLETHVTGAAAISSDYLDAVKAGTDSTTAITVVLVLLILLLIYRAPLAALVPLITIGSAFMVSRGTLGLLAAAGWEVSSLLDTFLVVMVFGVGTDYAIFLISRYREEVSGGGDWHDAARTTVKRIGAVITASAATVIVGMASMAFGEFKMIASTGPAIAVAIFVTLVAGLTLAPALLSIFGHYLFWPLHARPRPEGEPTGFFARLAAAVSRRPGLVTVVLLIALLVPATYLPQVKTNFDVLSELPADSDSRAGYDAMAQHLGEDMLVQSAGLVDAGPGGDMLSPASLAHLRDLTTSLSAAPGVATVTSLVTPGGDGVVPDGFRPSKQLATIGDGMAGDDGTTDTDSASLLDPEVSDGLDTALAYVNGLALAYPDVAGGTELRAVTGGIGDAQDIIKRVEKQSVLSTQLRTLASSITSPSAAAGSDSGAEDSSTLMGDYLDELAVAYPEVRSLDAYRKATKAAASLEKDATITAALDLAAAFEDLAIHFDGRPEATLSPKSLADTSGARELKREAEAVFGALPDQFAALGAVFAARPDDLYLPTMFTGEDGKKVQDAIDAFVSKDRAATRFYVTNSNDPYSGGAFVIVRAAQDVIARESAAFGPGASGHLGGPTAQFADVEDTLSQDFQRVAVITVLGILLVLVVLLRAVVAPLYLVGTVLISYASAVGLSAWFFQEVLGQPGVSFYLPLMVFVLLVALGSDYNIFLMSRVREESEHRPIKDGIRIASGHTGAVITSAGLILAGTFGSMATAPLMVLFQVGVAVAVGVLIDTFLVRSILVPAITTLVGDRAWWPSGSTLAGMLGRGPLVPAGAGAGAGVGMAGAGAGAAVAASVAGATVASAGAASAGPVSRRRLVVALGLVVLLPVMVAGLLTWSLGGSDSNLGSLRAAVVDLDEGGSVTAADGTVRDLSLGADLSAALTTVPGAGDGFRWSTTDEADATAGLADGRYAAVLTIPPDFSRTVAALRADPTGRAPRAALRLTTDDGSSYALGTVARAVTAAIAASTAQGITASYVDDTLLAVTSAHEALASAADDAGSVATTTSGLADDAAGTSTVAGELVAGLRELADGADSAAGGTDKLLNGTRSLATGSSKLAGGAKALAGGTQDAAKGAGSLADGAASLASGLAALEGSTRNLPAQADALASGAAGVASGAAGVASGASSLAGGLATMATQTTGFGARAQALDAGAGDLKSGAAALSNGADQAAAAASSLATGASQLSSNVTDYTNGVSALAGNCVALGGTDPLCTQLAALAGSGGQLSAAAGGVASGAGQLAGANAGLASGAQDLQSGAGRLKAGTGQLAASAPALEAGIAQSATGAADLATGASSLSAGADQVAGGTRQLADGMPALADGIARLAAGGASVSGGASGLASGMDKLASGAGTLASGARQTAAGAAALADGTSQAADGIDQLTGAVRQAVGGAALVEAQADGLANDGVALTDKADALANGLRTSADGTGSYADETRTRMGDLAADPVGVDASRVNAVGGPAGGLAPFLMAIAIWLGALGAFLVLPGLWRGEDPRWWRSVLVAYAGAAAVAVAGALLMVAGLTVLVGVDVARMPELLGFAVLAALAFTAIIQALVALFGSRGWLAALLFLVVQIAASGVLLSAATLPGPLAVLHPFVPLTYAIDAFRGAITGGASATALNAAVLVAWLVAAVLVTLAVGAGASMRKEADAVAVA